MRRVFGLIGIAPIGIALLGVSLLVIVIPHVALPGTISAANVRGTVTSAEERTPSIGAKVLVADGTPVGQVSGIVRDLKGYVFRIRIATAAPLGFGERTITVREDLFFVQGDAVRLRLTIAQVSALPSVMTEDDERQDES